MGTHTGSVLTLANSIIGVSVLAMPFCFKQCGIVLSILLLLVSSIVSRLACYYLIKSAIMEKRRNFEMLAFRAFGPTGKLMVELCIIGFMLGTCVAFFVVVGDLGPAIMAPILGFEHPSALRPSVLIALGIFVVLPLGLLRNVDSLTTLSAASIAFYLCLVLKVMGEATTHLVAGDWLDKVHYWRPAGVLQCIPIFSMALSCQTQLFEIFDSLHTTPLDRMTSVVRSAINMTTSFYIAVGFFGYVAFCHQSFSGNLMLSFSPNLTSTVIKLGFVLSVAVSFPLVIFPCRASIYSLLFSKGHGHELSGSAHIPETKFQCITLVIITCSLVTGLLIPNIEVVLGLVGSTIGVFICLVFPAVIFITLSKRNTNERLLAKILVGAGLFVMVLSTYTNLSVTNEGGAHTVAEIDLPHLQASDHKDLPIVPEKVIIKDETLNKLKDVEELAALPELRKDLPAKAMTPKEVSPSTAGPQPADKEIRKEPPNPINPVISEKRREPPVPVDPDKNPPSPKKELHLILPSTKKKPIKELTEEEKNRKDELLQKLIRHEEDHKKLMDDGKLLLVEGEQILNEIKKEKEEDKTKKIKVIDVKTGKVQDQKKLDPKRLENEVIPRNISEFSPVLKKEDIIKTKDLPEVKLEKEMVQIMEKGVPLPVAIKGVSSLNEPVAPKEPEVKREEREKRDLSHQIEPSEKAPTSSEISKEQEECPKKNKTEIPKESLIKTPSYLSAPNPILEANLNIANAPVNADALPLKRDLTSVLGPESVNIEKISSNGVLPLKRDLKSFPGQESVNVGKK